MTKKVFEQLKAIVEEQEQMLRFDSFSNEEAWQLGSFLVNKVYELEMELALSIRRLSGAIIFQHETEGTNAMNDKWMYSKFNTVCLNEQSSFGAWVDANIKDEDVDTHGLDPKEYVFIGGGFPIRLKTGEVVAVLIASNLPHQMDHQFLVDGLAEYLELQNVPSVTALF